jgi:F420-0:gamma-glutamyl ligase
MVGNKANANILPKPNKGKKLYAVVDGKKYARYPIKTHKITAEDEIVNTISKYVKSYINPGDTLCISERIIAIMQGRSYPIDNINPSKFAVLLSKYVTDHPGGIGLRSPWTMELAIREAGLLRIIFAAFVSVLTKPMGIKGLFYHVAGNGVNAIDGPCDYTLPPGNTHAKLGPKNPERVAQELTNSLACKIAIIDANDYGVCVLGASNGVKQETIVQIFKDNPLGQSNEQTPLALVRHVTA